MTFGSYFALYYACKPLNWWKSLMLAGVLVLVLLGIFALPWFFGYVRLNGVEILLLVSSVLISFPLLKFNMWLVAKIVNAARRICQAFETKRRNSVKTALVTGASRGIGKAVARFWQSRAIP